MAKDDDYVIVFKVLSYLYKYLKNGIKADEQMIKPDGMLFRVCEAYWNYILFHTHWNASSFPVHY